MSRPSPSSVQCTESVPGTEYCQYSSQLRNFLPHTVRMHARWMYHNFINHNIYIGTVYRSLYEYHSYRKEYTTVVTTYDSYTTSPFDLEKALENEHRRTLRNILSSLLFSPVSLYLIHDWLCSCVFCWARASDSDFFGRRETNNHLESSWYTTSKRNASGVVFYLPVILVVRIT